MSRKSGFIIILNTNISIRDRWQLMMSVEDVDTAIKASVNIGATLQQLSV